MRDLAIFLEIAVAISSLTFGGDKDFVIIDRDIHLDDSKTKVSKIGITVKKEEAIYNYTVKLLHRTAKGEYVFIIYLDSIPDVFDIFVVNKPDYIITNDTLKLLKVCDKEDIIKYTTVLSNDKQTPIRTFQAINILNLTDYRAKNGYCYISKSQLLMLAKNIVLGYIKPLGWFIRILKFIKIIR